MSGLEVAGLALGAFPILQHGGQELRGAWRGLRTWWKFETEFEDFLDAIDIQHHAYRQNLDFLLDPIVELADEELAALKTDRGAGKLWHQPRIQALLRKRLPGTIYPWYMKQLREINEALDELYKIVPIQKLPNLLDGDLESEMKKLKISFSKRKNVLLDRIRDRNQQVYNQLTVVTCGLDAKRNSSQLRLGADVREIKSVQEQAQALFTCLSRNWQCHCGGAAHSFSITVESRGGKSGLKFMLDGANTTCIRVESRESMIKGKEREEGDGFVSPADVFSAKMQLTAANRIKRVRQSESRTVVALASSALSSLGRMDRSDFSELKSPSRKRFRVRFDLGQSHADVDETVQPAQYDSTLIVPTGIQSTMAICQGAEHEQETASANETDLATTPALVVLCEQLTKPPVASSRVACLQVDDARQLELHVDAAEQSHLHAFSMTSLPDILRDVPKRDARLRIGLHSAFVMLSLGATPWLPEDCQRTHVVFLHHFPTSASQPYIASGKSLPDTLRRHPLHILAAVSDSPSSRPDVQARSSLFALGVMLLELLFRETLESQPFRKDYLGAAGEPNHLTDFCTATRWKGRVEEEFGGMLADAIDRCVMCRFGPSPDLGNMEFLQEVWTAVVKPVEGFLRAWGSPVRP